MQRIVAGIASIEQHEQAIEQTPDIYRPPCCPHCGIKVVWRHGRYHRKADLCQRGEANRNPVPILRYSCSACRRTCSRLPECIAPRRWYNWFVQEAWLRTTLELKVIPPSSCPTPAQRTLGRWRHWLQECSRHFHFFLTSRFPDLGRAGDDDGFWLGVFDTLGLSRAMTWCDQAFSVP